MEILFSNQKESHFIEVYNEYLKKIPDLLKPVSYTHLDVYKRQYKRYGSSRFNLKGNI